MTVKIKVLTSLIETDLESIKQKIALVEPYLDLVQIDVMDGIFVPNVTINNPEKFKQLKVSCNLEYHLMIAEPARQINGWLQLDSKNIFFHYEAVKDRAEILPLIKLIQASGKGAGLAINPKTEFLAIEPYLSVVDLVMCLTVEPGFSGQRFDPSVLPKIKAIRQKYPNLPIEVDGGINPETGKLAVEAGATILNANSFIFTSKNIKAAIDSLRC